MNATARPSDEAVNTPTFEASLRVVPASQQADTVTQLTAAFQLNLTAFSLLALAVGMFLIYNTTLFSVVQRRRILGILRCIGVTGRQIFAMILIEAAISGVIGSIIGVGQGILLGRLTVALVTQTINDLYFAVTVRSVDVDAFSIVKGSGRPAMVRPTRTSSCSASPSRRASRSWGCCARWTAAPGRRTWTSRSMPSWCRRACTSPAA